MSNYETVFTLAEIIANFRRGEYVDSYWSDAAAVTYGFASSVDAYPPWYGPKLSGFSPFTPDQQQAAIMAIALWTDVANIVISPAADGDHSNIRFADTTTGPTVASAYMPAISPSFGGDIWVNPNYETNQSPLTLGGYGFKTLLHEIGHAIGLPHPGDYNGEGASYESDALYQRDTRQYTVMSYFPASLTGAHHGGYYASTPLVADIAAIQFVYGANMATRADDTVYGYHTNIADRPEFDFTVNTHPIVAIWDGGGNDTIDLSGSNQDAYLDLAQGAFSDVLGLTKNLAVAYGAVIENAIGTSGLDTIIGNDAGNTLAGGEGDDSLIGGAGIDTAIFSGNSSLYTIAWAGNVTVSGPDGADTLTGIEKAVFDDSMVPLGQGPTHTDFNGDLNADLLWQHDSGTAVEWLMNGTAFASGGAAGPNPGTAWHVKGGGDFNGDGKADILWQNSDGTPVVWFMNGTTMLGGGVLGFNPGPAWQTIGSGDFNGDGYADILWQNADGTPAIWLMNGMTLLSGASYVNPGTAWHVIGAGDFDGNGKSDILWQNTDGTPAVWLMNGSSFVSGSEVGTNPGPLWHVKAAGDFNGDGKSDIVWQHDDGTPVIWFLNGTSFVSGGVAGFNPGTAWHAIGAGDFNGDGKCDIEWQNSDGTPALWLMNGTSLISGGSFVNPGPSWHMLTMGS